MGGVHQFPPHHLSSNFTIISAHKYVHDPRRTPSGRKVIRRRRKREEEREKQTLNSVATMFATDPVCNAAWAVHVLRLDQNSA
jgi:hypothetical protein